MKCDLHWYCPQNVGWYLILQVRRAGTIGRHEQNSALKGVERIGDRDRASEVSCASIIAYIVSLITGERLKYIFRVSSCNDKASE